jgi:hypothetical protein
MERGTHLIHSKSATKYTTDDLEWQVSECLKGVVATYVAYAVSKYRVIITNDVSA